jgi:hypothetical protein
MRKMRSPDSVVEATVGYSADRHGKGIAYARVTGDSAKLLLRLPFRVGSPPPFADRAVAYAALIAVTRALRKRSIREVRFVLGDARFVEEIVTGRGIGDALALPYVRLRCMLNALATFEVRTAPTDDLTQRAQAEVALNVAA